MHRLLPMVMVHKEFWFCSSSYFLCKTASGCYVYLDTSAQIYLDLCNSILHDMKWHLIIFEICVNDHTAVLGLGEDMVLSWADRFQIVLDISHGIEYLHEGVCL